METNTTAHNEDLVFTEIPFPKRKAAYEKPAVVINSSKGKIYIHNHADLELVRKILSCL
ncbi:hypothetical protein [Dubosiella newyorkensis]|uniref:hypothetical protein n=1 Tax=Dubosiella newyorkensis TaxID=1862672 RepID=UPI00248BE216|nr:hypothetical protein [Dubosiella newyorkensis]